MKHFYILPYHIELHTESQRFSIPEDSFLLLYILNGYVFSTDSDVTHILNTNDMLLLTSDFASHGQLDVHNNIPSLYALIYIDKLYFAAQNHFIIPEIVLNTAANPVHNYIPLNQSVTALINTYFQAPADSKVLSEQIIPVIQNLCNYTVAMDMTPDKNSRTLEIMYYLHNNYRFPITLSEAAEYFHLTEPYLSAYISKHLGCSFSKYLTRLRLEAALRYLRYAPATCTQIYNMVGFPNATSFNNIFKNTYGQTPYNYQKQASHHDRSFHALTFCDNPDFEGYQRIYQSDLFPKTFRMESRKNPLVTAKGAYNHTSLMPDFSINAAHFSSPKTLIPVPLFTQIQYTQKELGFRHLRVNRLFYSDIITTDENGHQPNFSIVDSLLSTIAEMNCIPVIIINLIEKKSTQLNSQVYDTFTRFFDHCTEEYGIERLRQWRFEISDPFFFESEFSQIRHTLEVYAKISLKIIQYVKSKIPEIKIGGPMIEASSDMNNLRYILTYWKAHGTIPDYIGTMLTPYISSAVPPQKTIVSSNPGIMNRRLSRFEQCIQDALGQELPIFSEILFNFYSGNYLNDSLFQAVCQIHFILKFKERIRQFMLPSPTDFIPETPKPIDQFLTGTAGLLTWDGIPKPIFFALKFLKSLGNLILSEQDGCIVTRDVYGKISILMYNYSHPDPVYCNHPELAGTAKNIPTFFANHPSKEFHIALSDLPVSRYFTEEFTLSREHGSILDMWLRSNDTAKLSQAAVQNIKNHVHPEYRFYTLHAQPELVIESSLEVNEIKLIQLQPETR